MEDRTIGLIVIGSWIGAIEIAAISQGINGQLLMGTIAALVGLFGYFIGKKPPRILLPEDMNFGDR